MMDKNKVGDLSIEEFKSLIRETVKSTFQDIIEDVQALSNENYIQAIEMARKDYKEGRITKIEDLNV